MNFDPLVDRPPILHDVIASRLLATRFPDAIGGSVARSEDIATSDLDLVVLLPGAPAPTRTIERPTGG